MALHTAGSRKAGVAETKLKVLDDPFNAPLFSAAERAALRLAEAMTQLPVLVPQELVAEVRAHCGTAGLVEIAGIIAAENFRARFNRVFDVEPNGLAACAGEIATES